MIAGPPYSLLLEFGEQKFKHESMNPANAQNPNKCPCPSADILSSFFFLFFFLRIFEPNPVRFSICVNLEMFTWAEKSRELVKFSKKKKKKKIEKRRTTLGKVVKVRKEFGVYATVLGGTRFLLPLFLGGCRWLRVNYAGCIFAGVEGERHCGSSTKCKHLYKWGVSGRSRERLKADFLHDHCNSWPL